ncbi:MAG: transcription-repair coupling factor [Desulfobacteraceae bacterium 4572_88]|nr:MAG: transcription-repair coupling factor [Desulfobacteraceae bacterium 4572_88]
MNECLTMFMDQNQGKKSPQHFIDQIFHTRQEIECTGLQGAALAYFVSEIQREHNRPVLVIVPSPRDAESFSEDIRFFSEPSAPPSVHFIPYNIFPFKRLSYHNETAAKRIRALYQLSTGEVSPIMVTTAEALMQKLIPKQEISDYAELLMTGEETHRDTLIRKLIAGGYTRSAIVEEPGDFCARGGILDVFSPSYPDPVRIEFFGDMVDSLRFFSAASQRTTAHLDEAVLLPAREAIMKMADMDPFIRRVRKHALLLGLPLSSVTTITDRIRDEGVFPGIESLISLIYPRLDTFFDYVPHQALFILTEPGSLEKAAKACQEQIMENYASTCDEGRLCVEPDALYLKWPAVMEQIERKKPLFIRALPVLTSPSESQARCSAHFSIENNSEMTATLRDSREKGSLLLPLVQWINEKKEAGYATVISCRTTSQADRLRSLLQPYGIAPELSESFPDPGRARGSVHISLGPVSSGFVWEDLCVALVTEQEIFGAARTRRKVPKQKIQTGLLAFGDLKTGDLVVHIEHGIGRYEGLVKLDMNGNANDFLLLCYKDNDRLYLPVDRMSMIQKYMGVDGFEPILDKMGGSSWERVKGKVRKSVEKMAGELLKLYAARRVRSGYAYEKPNGSFQDFEAGFPYEETPDQIRAIEDVLDDMTSPTPMDRLICGDVGYGKTEVALRASLVAINACKQVAVLVPTTVLAEQHFSTFSSRFEAYPVQVACLSRFRSSKEQRKIVEGMKNGSIDIVIGTHRLLQKDVSFRDLGLLVLDEEQRFGVRHKEKLKKIRSTVDVLALTATPIPRTLHMSMMGIRDISVISTPPEQRHPIITYISEFDDAVISEAIQRELKRKGQIFFVHNAIHNIARMASRVKKLVPEVRLDVAHGRLSEEELETVMLRFMNREIDMLVCTTIIESGLDVPAANTILVNRADRFGLAQIYQLRGRVGRGDEQAYAYLFIPSESVLGKDAQKRLKVLMEHSDLGSGFQIAMSDLKIRGGGTILGASQSGHIAAVGYDMFLKLMEHAVSELKGEPVADDLEPEINMSLSAFIAESYIPDIDQRLSAYRRLAKMKSLREISDFKAELTDRFGKLPAEAVNLLLKIMLKVLSIRAGVRRLDLADQHLALYFSEAHQKNPFGIMDMISTDSRRFKFTPDHVLKVRLEKRGAGMPLAESKNILKRIAQSVNN